MVGILTEWFFDRCCMITRLESEEKELGATISDALGMFYVG